MKPGNSDDGVVPARRAWAPYFVLTLSLLLTALAAYYVARATDARDRLKFQNTTEDLRDNIQNRMDRYLALLESGGALFAATDGISHSEFTVYTDRLNLRQQYPGVQGIGFAERIRSGDRGSLVRAMRSQGELDFRIYPDGPQPEYYPVVYLEPLDRRNQAAIGYDMFSEPVRREAMERARDSGLPAATGRVTLVQEIDDKKQEGFLIYVPVYRRESAPTTVEERRAALMGFVYSPFRAGDLLGGIHALDENRAVDFEVFDGTQASPDQLLYRSNGAVTPGSGSEYSPRFTSASAILVAGRPWRLSFFARPQFESATSGRWLVPLIGLGGVVVSLVLFGVTQAQTIARAAAERAAGNLRRSETALRASESRLRRLVEANIIGIIIGDFEKHNVEVNDAFLDIIGYTREDLREGKINWAEMTPPEYRPLDERAREEMLRTGRHTPFEKEYIRKDGTRAPVLVGTASLDGSSNMAVGFLLDLTERKRAEEAIRFQARLLDAVEQAAIATDVKGTITYWNRYAETLYGWPAAEALGRNIMEVTPAAESQDEANQIMSALRAGKSWSGEILLHRRDGTIFPALVTDSPIYDDAGSLIGIVGVSSDISERKRTEEAVRAADQRAITEYKRLLERITLLAQALGTARDLQTIFRGLRDFAVASVPCVGIFISLYDPQRDVRTASYGWGDGQEIDISTLPALPVSTEGPNSRAVRTGEIIITDDYMGATRDHPGIVIGPDNGLRPQSSLVVPMSVMGRIVGTIEVQSYERAAYHEEHVTALRMAANLAAVAIENVQLFERESRARASAEESNRMKDEFLATVSHEIRTPLTSILGWSRMLSSGTLNEATSARALETIERNAKIQAQIIDDILDVSRVITGKLQLDAAPVDLVSVIEAAINAVRPAAEAKGIRLETAIDPGAGQVSGDSSRLQQVVWNLLSNAVKFTPAGGKIEVVLRGLPSQVELQVSDTGQGISREFLPYVFDRFRQADSSTTRRHGGLGLGLAIVRHLVELHGGSVGVESAGEGRGTTFTVRLPAIDGMKQIGGEQSTAARRASAPPDDGTSLEGLHVLIVDDEPDTLLMLRTALEERLARVTVVAAASEALKAIAKTRPDVLVSDIGMPGMDGYQLIRLIRSLRPEMGGRIPAIALTAYARKEDRERALSLGYQQHLQKPVEPVELVTVIAGLAAARSKAGENGDRG